MILIISVEKELKYKEESTDIHAVIMSAFQYQEKKKSSLPMQCTSSTSGVEKKGENKS